MKRILVLLAIVILFVVGCSMFVVNQGPSKQEMIEVLKSDEAISVIEKSLKNLDSNALTESGVIRSYEIDYTTVKWNPMGGIIFTTYINGDSKLYMNSTMSKHNDKLELGGGISVDLSVLTEGTRGE